MTPDQRLTIICGTIASSLYLAGVFIAGLVTAHPFAWKGAIATAGVIYLTAFVQVTGASRAVAIAVVSLSILLGAAAGLSLLV